MAGYKYRIKRVIWRGTISNAGRSLLAAAIRRHLTRPIRIRLSFRATLVRPSSSGVGPLDDLTALIRLAIEGEIRCTKDLAAGCLVLPRLRFFLACSSFWGPSTLRAWAALSVL